MVRFLLRWGVLNSSTLVIVAGGVAATATLASPAAGQGPVRVAVAAGGVISGQPAGRGGVTAQASLLVGSPARLLRLRADLLYVGVGRADTFGRPISSRASFVGTTLSATATLGAPAAGVRPYLLAGTGLYSPDGSRPNSPRAWRGGLHAGVGAAFRVGRAQWFAETRYHAIVDGLPGALVPISVGYRF